MNELVNKKYKLAKSLPYAVIGSAIKIESGKLYVQTIYISNGGWVFLGYLPDIGTLLSEGWIKEVLPVIEVGKYYRVNIVDDENDDRNGAIIFIISDDNEFWNLEEISGKVHSFRFKKDAWFCEKLIPLTPDEVKEFEAELKKDEPLEFWANIYDRDFPFNVGLQYKTEQIAKRNIRSETKYLRTALFREMKEN
jgi:hypothetical protein